MKAVIAAIVVSVLVAGCATIPKTVVYRQAEGQISKTILVLPVTDDTPGKQIDLTALASLRKDLIQGLKASGRFTNIYDTLPANSQTEVTYVRCKVSQFDISARRMAMVTEFLQGNADRPFMRLVTHTYLISMVWPIDYVGVMGRAANTAVNDVVETMVRSMRNE